MKKHKKLLCCIQAMLLTLIMTMQSVGAVELWDGFVELANRSSTWEVINLNNFGLVLESGAVPSSLHTRDEYKYSALWENPDVNTRLTFTNVPKDFTKYTEVECWIYSEKATNSQFMCCVEEANGAYSHPGVIKVDWKGWKKFQWLIGEGYESYNPTYKDVVRIRFHSSGWGMTTQPGTSLYIGSLKVKKSLSFDAASFTEDEMAQMEEINMKATSVYADRACMLSEGINTYVDPTNRSITTIKAENGKVMVPQGFFGTHLGQELTVNSDKTSYTIGTATANFETPCIEQNELLYVPLAEIAKTAGLYTAEYGNLATVCKEDIVSGVAENEYLAELVAYSATYKYVDAADVTEEDYTIAKQNWRNYLIGDGSYDVNDTRIKNKITSIENTAEGSWKTMNKGKTIYDVPVLFGNQLTTTAEMTNMYAKLYNMTLGYCVKGSKYEGNEALFADIKFGLDWMYEYAYGANIVEKRGSFNPSFNWYDWQISAPQRLVNILMLLEDKFTEKEIAKYLSPADKKVKVENNGSNRSYLSMISIGLGLLEHDLDKIMAGRDGLDRSLPFSRNMGEGPHKDGTYIMHGYFLMNGAYGGSLLTSVAPILSVINGTEFEVQNPMKRYVNDWLREMVDPIIFQGGRMSMTAARGRGWERNSAVNMFAPMLDLIDGLDEEDAAWAKSMIKYNVQQNTATNYWTTAYMNLSQVTKLAKIMDDDTLPEYDSKNISKAFHFGDQFVHKRTDWAAGVAMHSSRMMDYESINSQNMRGWYMNGGMLYMYTKGDMEQYEDPWWNNVNGYHMPCVTNDTQERPEMSSYQGWLSHQDYVGSVSVDDTWGMAAMDFESYNSDVPIGKDSGDYGSARPAHDSSLTANKAYFMFDDEIVAIGNEINAEDDVNVETTIDNRLLRKKEKLQSNSAAIAYDVVNVTAVGNDGNVETNVIDGDGDTRWSYEANENAWLMLELDGVHEIGYIGIALVAGDERITGFDLMLSEDGENWTTVFSGESSGTTSAMVAYDCGGVKAKYVKFVGRGNNKNGWNSISEMKAFAVQPNGKMPVDVDAGFLYGSEVIRVNGNALEKAAGYEKTMDNTSWVSIEDVGGYYFPTPVTLNMKKTNSNLSFLEMWVDHGVNPSNASYAYVMLPNMTEEQTRVYAENPDIQILSNTGILQAVYDKSTKTTGMAFRQAGSCGNITVSAPSQVIMTETDGELHIAISEPTHKLDNVVVKINEDVELISCDEKMKIEKSDCTTIITIDCKDAYGAGFEAKFSK